MSLDRSKEGVIKAWFDYNPETSEILWKEWVSPDWYKHDGYHKRFMEERSGKVVKFHKLPTGYLYIDAGKIKTIYAHQIAWVLNYGELPSHCVDHIDGNRENNSIENLRDVPQKINARNSKLSKNNTSGAAGVSWDQKNKKWRSQLMVDGKTLVFGRFDTVTEAAKARQKYLDSNKNLGFSKRHGKK